MILEILTLTFKITASAAIIFFMLCLMLLLHDNTRGISTAIIACLLLIFLMSAFIVNEKHRMEKHILKEEVDFVNREYLKE